VLAVSDEAVQLTFRLSNGVTVQIALRFDFEPRVFEGVEDARVCGSTLSEDDSAALTLHPQRFAWLPRGSSWCAPRR
jgi:hypothetical protein